MKRKSIPLNTLVTMLPTPLGNSGNGAGEHGQGGENLQTEIGGKLNPEFVEWLMGYPIGWTDYGVSETR